MCGQYQPGTNAGRQLLAHELTHVVQHDRAPFATGSGVSRPGDASEHEAAGVARAVGGGGPLPQIAASPVAAVQRGPNDADAAGGGGSVPVPVVAPPQPTTAPEGKQQAPTAGHQTPEFFNLQGVLEVKGRMERRLDNLAEFASIAMRTGDTTRSKTLIYSEKYKNAYEEHARAVRAAKLEANNQNTLIASCRPRASR
jgi:hypothetical protein